MDLKRSRPVTPVYLRNAAMHYLSGRSASAAMVREVLARRARRRLGVRTLGEQTVALVDAVIADLERRGLLDDARFAEGRAAALASKGLSGRRIALGLRAKGIAASAIEGVGAAVVDDLAQARRYVERKRLGPHRRGGATAASLAKDLRALARAGFSYAVAKAALEEAGSASG